jgi:protocatechuate 3,4-dioxygenase beta subunit
MPASPRLTASVRLAALLLAGVSMPLAAEPIRVSGSVIRGLDQGVSGARVEILPAYESYAEAVRRLREGSGAAPLAAASTGADGGFELAVPASGCFRLVVRADGYLPMENPLVPLMEDTNLAPVPLIPASLLEVQVVGDDGRPLAGIEVGIEDAQERMLRATLGTNIGEEISRRWRLADRSGISGPDGKVTLPRSPGEAPVLTALSPRFLGQHMAAASPGPAAVFRLLPRPTAKLEARDAGDRPVAGALIRWRSHPVAVTGPRGRVEIAPAEGDPFDLESAGGGWARVAPKPGSQVLPVRLLPRRRITGKVLDAVSRAPLRGAMVWAGRPPVAPVAFSSAGGAFQLDAPPREVQLEGAAPGFFLDKPPTAPPGVAAPVLLTLTPAAAISGLVVDAAGQPVATAQVGLDSRLPPYVDGGTIRTGPDGRFRLTGLHPDSAYGLVAAREGRAVTKATVRTAPAGRSTPPVRIVMAPGTTLSGRVAGEDGQPVAGAKLVLMNLQAIGKVAQATSDEEGRFELRHLSAGKLDLLAEHPRHARAHLAGIEITAGGTAVDLGTVTMPDGTAIEGRVTDSRGTPIAGAEVQAAPESRDPFDLIPLQWGEDGSTGGARTGVDGGFRVEPLRRGALYNVAVTHPGYATASAPRVKTPTEEPVRIEMKEARTLSGRVVGPEGEPVPGASLTWFEENRTGLRTSSSSRSLGQTDDDGRFQVLDLLPGTTANLAVQAQGYQPRQVEGLRIPEDRDLTDVKVALERAALLEVRVISAEGEPVSGVWVRAEPKRKKLETGTFGLGAQVEPGNTDAGGRCRLSVQPGTYDVVAMKEGQAVRESVVAGSASTAVELRFPPGAPVSGRVVGEDGMGIGNVAVTMRQARSLLVWAQTEADGTFRFAGVARGSYRLEAREMTSERSSDPLEIVVAGEPVRNLELRLGPRRDGVTLTGRLLGLAPEEIPQVQVSASGGEEISRQGSVAREGIYRIEDIMPGEWEVYAYLPTGRAAQGKLRIEPGSRAANLDLEFPAGLTLSGRVLVDGSPLAGAEVQLLSSRGGTLTDLTAYDGRFTFRSAPPGDATLLISGPGGIGGSRSFRITESLEMPVELSTGRLGGTVLAASGEPVEDAVLEMQGWLPELKMPFLSTSARSGAGGAFEVPRLGAGTYRITVRKNGFAPAEVRVEILPGRETTVEVRLQPR